MSITIKFLIKLDKNEYHTVVAHLKSTQFEVDSLTYFDENTLIPSELTCSKLFEQWPQVVNEQNILNNITGIMKIFVFNHEITEIKPKWYTHWIFPMLISMGVTMASSFILVNRLKPDASLNDYLIFTIIPPVIAFFSSVAIRLNLKTP
jgi:hypothetical protein